MTQAEMTTLINLLQGEREKTQEIADRLRKNLSSAPDGKLLVSHSNGRTQFYCRIGEGIQNRVYLSQKDQKIIQQLAQKKYDASLLSKCNKNVDVLNKAILQLQKFSDPENTMTEIPEVLQAKIAVPFLSTEDFVQQWLDDEKQEGPDGRQNEWHSENLIYSTDAGERVRSKSEMMIANLLFAMQLPYQYEKPLYLNGKTVLPDFTILDTKTRTEVYFEHFGLMDQEEYRTAALLKIENYEKAGFMLGKDFLFSFESERVPFDVIWIREKLYKRFEL